MRAGFPGGGGATKSYIIEAIQQNNVLEVGLLVSEKMKQAIVGLESMKESQGKNR